MFKFDGWSSFRTVSFLAATSLAMALPPRACTQRPFAATLTPLSSCCEPGCSPSSLLSCSHCFRCCSRLPQLSCSHCPCCRSRLPQLIKKGLAHEWSNPKRVSLTAQVRERLDRTRLLLGGLFGFGASRVGWAFVCKPEAGPQAAGGGRPFLVGTCWPHCKADAWPGTHPPSDSLHPVQGFALAERLYRKEVARGAVEPMPGIPTSGAAQGWEGLRMARSGSLCLQRSAPGGW